MLRIVYGESGTALTVAAIFESVRMEVNMPTPDDQNRLMRSPSPLDPAPDTAAEPNGQEQGSGRGRAGNPLDQGQILDATEAVLHEHGYDGTTIRRIASHLGCAVGSIYRYFTDKRALLDAVCQRRFDGIASHAELGSPLPQTCSMYVRVAHEQPELYRLMFWLASVGKRNPQQALPGVIRRVLAGWHQQLGDEQRARRLWMRLHGCVMLGCSPEQALEELDLKQTRQPRPDTPAAQRTQVSQPSET